MWLYTLNPAERDRNVTDAFIRELRWGTEPGSDTEDVQWRTEQPAATTRGIIFVVHRLGWNSAARTIELRREKILPTRMLATPVGTFGLRGVVFYSGRHYTTIFIRDDGSAWLANDAHVANVTAYLDAFLEDRQHMVYMMFYDKHANQPPP